MLILLTQFASSSSGLGSLGLNVQSFLIQLGTFIIAFLALRKWAFKPILKILQERRETIEKGVLLGEQMRQKEAELKDRVEKTLHEARAKADGLVTEAEEAARQSVREAEEAARAKAENIINEGKTRGEQEVTRARKTLEKEVAGWVSDVTEVIIGEKVDAKKDASLIDKALKTRTVA